ncbi:RNase P subunit p30 family protein [uncultured Methanofollis sp.]|uniref:RNase P subunit p30 family protein n=1 Tax=uncultured Methanofollis sp. TaxID=262500 RepID=UPI002627D570|nr:RNase P subunit p30 family protein [uncultured Methanofollis sp.]
MAYTDACVHPYPDGDTTLSRMALEARECGFDRIVSTTGSGEFSGVQVVQGIVITAANVREMTRGVRRAPPGALVMIEAGDEGFNRSAVALSGVHVLRGLGRAGKHAFDHVAARIASDSGVAVEVDLAPVITLRGRERQKVLQRYADLLVLQHHYDFPLTVASNARSCLDLRTVRDVVGLCSLFGMEEEETLSALSSVDGLREHPKPVQVVG